MRKRPPDRRTSWTQKVRIGGQVFYLGFGEYEDGSLAELFIDASKEGTYVRGILGAFARLSSVALQHEVPVEEVAKCLRDCNFPPQGQVEGSPAVAECTSVVDWIAQEAEVAYGRKEGGENPNTNTTLPT